MNNIQVLTELKETKQQQIIPITQVSADSGNKQEILGVYIASKKNDHISVKVHNTRYHEEPHQIKLVRLGNLCDYLGIKHYTIKELRLPVGIAGSELLKCIDRANAHQNQSPAYYRVGRPSH